MWPNSLGQGRDLEKKFEPSLLNTAIYLLGLSQQVSTFVLNFQVSCSMKVVMKWQLIVPGPTFPRRYPREPTFVLGSSRSQRCCILWSNGIYSRAQQLAPTRRHDCFGELKTTTWILS